MTVMEIKTELKHLIEQETDPGVLKAIRTLLKKTRIDSRLQDKLTIRALKSEEDIQEGRLLSRDEMERDTDDLI